MLPDAKGDKQKSYTKYIVEAAASIVILRILYYLYYPGFVAYKPAGEWTQCESNQQIIGAALEMYANDNNGLCPTSLSVLTPNYLKIIPTCAAAKNDTYSPSYQYYNGKGKSPASNYTFYCKGWHHKWAGQKPNCPNYTALKGLGMDPLPSP